MPRVLVIGGGAAGIIAARRAAERGAAVTLLEKNDRLGTKILISGGGKCNLTHDGDMDSIRRTFRQNEGVFLNPAFHAFTNRQFLDILRSRGMDVYTRPDGRIFPVEPANAKDVVAILTQYVLDANVQIRYQHPVTELIVEDGSVMGARAAGRDFRADATIICTGGSSYPATGATGDGWRWLQALGHTIVPLRAALAPIYLRGAQPDWSGIALREVILKARHAGKEISRWTGDLLFTHRGISGPSALGISRAIAELPGGSLASVEVDCVPASSFEKMQEELRSQIKESPRKTAASLVAPFVPARLVEPILAAAQIDGETRGAHLPAKSLNRIVSTLKGWNLGDVQHVPLERGEVVAGGVALDEVDPRTMRSKIASRLFLCGEVLDIAGPVGGYNLQAAWSTGYVAGDHAARS